MLKLAVVGKDVSKSLSPAMHTFLLKKMGEECTYECVSIPPEEFSARAQEFLERYDGFNVTIPFKTDIIPHLAGTADHGIGHACKLRHGNPVALVGRSFLHFVQKDKSVFIFNGGHMHIGDFRRRLFKFCELKIVRGKKREALFHKRQFMRDCRRKA